MLSSAVAGAQLVDITDPSATIVEEFDGLGTSSSAILPNGWRIHTSSSFIGAVSQLDRSGGTTGSQTVSSAGGYYNFGNGENLIATDRAAGFLAAFNRNINGASLYLGMQNLSGAAIDDVQISYDVEKYRSGSVFFDIHFSYGADGINWIQVPEATVHYDRDFDFAIHHPPTSTSRSFSLSSLSIADQAGFYLRWQYSGGSSTGAQALGIDNVRLRFGSAPSLLWAGADGSLWDSQSTNWLNGSGQNVLWNDGAGEAIFGEAPDVTSNVVLASPRVVASLTFEAPTRTYTISESTIEITAPGGTGIDARSNANVQSSVLVSTSQEWKVDSSLTISGPLTIAPGRTITKSGPGTLRLSGSQNPGDEAALKITAGTLRLAANANGVGLSIEGNIDETNSQAILETNQDLSSLAISVTDPGHQGLDLASPAEVGQYRELRIHDDSVSLKSSLHHLISHARANPGDGIYDSGAALRNAVLGVADVGGYVLIRPTRLGDLNLDGSVTIADFISLASNFNRSDVTWQEGDVNGDNAVTIADFISLASNFNASYSGESLPISASDRAALDAFAAAHGVALPEPGLGFALLGTVALLRRRRLQS